MSESRHTIRVDVDAEQAKREIRSLRRTVKAPTWRRLVTSTIAVAFAVVGAFEQSAYQIALGCFLLLYEDF